MKLAYLVSQYPATSHTFIHREIEALRKHDVEVETFSVRLPSKAEQESERQEFEQTWYILPPKPARLLRAHARQMFRRPSSYARTLRRAFSHRVPGLRAALWAGFHFVESVALADELEVRGIDHLHNHFANSGANVGFLATRLLEVDWSLTLHGISEFDYPAGLLLAEKISAASFVACVTHFGRAQAMRIVEPEQWKKFLIVRCGVDVETFTQASSTVSVPAKQRTYRMLSVGRLSPEKGHVGLVEALRLVVDAGVDVELRLVGDGPERARIESRVKSLALERHVSFAGRLPASQIASELSHADVFVMSSFMEGLPVVIMEALSMEVPVIAPAVAGIPELIEHEKTGMVYPPSDWGKLSQCMIALLRDPKAAKAMAKAGKVRIVEEFEITRAIAPLVNRFRSSYA